MGKILKRKNYSVTLNEINECYPCEYAYRKLVRFLGGVGSYGKDTPIPFEKILKSNGYFDLKWLIGHLVIREIVIKSKRNKYDKFITITRKRIYKEVAGMPRLYDRLIKYDQICYDVLGIPLKER